MRQKIVADKEAGKDEVINDPLQIIPEWDLHVVEVEMKLISHILKPHKLEADSYLILTLQVIALALSEEMPNPPTVPTSFLLPRHNNLPDDVESRLVCHETQHNEIGISPVDTMRLVGIISVTGSLLTNILHYLVLPFSWVVGVREHDFQVLPQCMVIHPLHNIKL